MKTIGIVGAGLMGTDLALYTAEKGFTVLLHDVGEEPLRHSLDTIRERLHHYETLGRFDHPKADEILTSIQPYNKLEGLSPSDIVIECVTEDLGIKMEVFHKLDSICKAGAILASNTSSKSITAIASATHRPESVIGMHFMNPIRAMKLVEIICGLATTRETFQMAKQLVKTLGKEYVESRDFPGFLTNRILMPMLNEAIFAFYEGAGTVEAIDKAMTLGMNQPMGPLALADLIGLDVVLAVIEELYRGFGDSKYRPCPLLKKYVAAGYLGKKSGRGFYVY
ncbi:MAG TPA: 3-hydroxybutyryl-CoA dehydrogenase [Spirochaetes bacterium]|nr:3-hydroxybutyryl-CoA dehydrogenase [Spirochaetota bacterium]